VTARVVIVGAGFGGLACARVLRSAPVRVTLVDRHNFHTFQPLLYQVATAGLGADDIAHSVRGIFHDQPNVTFELGTVAAVDAERRTLRLEEGQEIRFDFLVVSAGATTATFGVPGVDEFALPLKSLPEALALRNHVLRQFEDVDREPALAESGALSVVIIGGGPTGVELAGAFTELFDMVLARDFPRVDMTRAKVVLLEATDHLLGPFSPPSREYAIDQLRARGVDVRLGTTVSRITADAVCVEDGDAVPTRTAVWVAGVRAGPLAPMLTSLGATTGPGGRVVVDAHHPHPPPPRIFVIGDIAAVPDGKGGTLPQLAPVAIQGGRHAARVLEASLRGRTVRPFHYHDKGTMATIGRNAAVAELPMRIRLTGFLAWVAWLFLHLMYLVGFRNRLNVFVNWAWNYLTYDRGARLIVAAGRD
jgi:NADH dehydrogenase